MQLAGNGNWKQTEFIMKYTKVAREKFGEKYKGEKV